MNNQNMPTIIVCIVLIGVLIAITVGLFVVSFTIPEAGIVFLLFAVSTTMFTIFFIYLLKILNDSKKKKYYTMPINDDDTHRTRIG